MFILQLTLGTADCFMYIWESQPVPNLTSSLYVTALEPYPLVTIQAYVCLFTKCLLQVAFFWTQCMRKQEK